MNGIEGVRGRLFGNNLTNINLGGTQGSQDSDTEITPNQTPESSQETNKENISINSRQVSRGSDTKKRAESLRGDSIAFRVKLKKRKSRRYQPGVVSGGENLKIIEEGIRWFKGSDRNVALMPGQIAERMRGKKYDGWDNFRRAFWKQVSKSPRLNRYFSPTSKTRIRRGYAPRVPSNQVKKGRSGYMYHMHHVRPIHEDGEVYSFDNIRIMTPLAHGAALDPSYHYSNSQENR